MLKPQSNGVKGTGKLAADDQLALKELPALRAFFLDQTYAGGQDERLPGVAIIKATGDGWLMVLKDPQSCQMIKLLARSWDEMLLMAESALVDPHAPWETDAYETDRRSKIRKRPS